MARKTRKIIVLVGIPASGKSTWAEEFIKNNPEAVRVNRDSYRQMLQYKPILDWRGEKALTEMVKSNIESLVKAGYDVVLDETNCNKKYFFSFINWLKALGNVEFKVFDTPVSTCIRRDLTRPAPVGAEIVNRMAKNFQALKDSGFDFQPINKVESRTREIAPWDPDASKPDAIIFDIDGTLAHNDGHRSFYDWSRVQFDKPNQRVIEILNSFYWEDTRDIILLSGRDGASRELTESWLKQENINYSKLFMREAGNQEKDSVIKERIYRKEIEPNYNVLAVFDDRNQVVNMWREIGLLCCQVAPGDF